MYKPKFQILLQSEQFYPDEFICLGQQLIKIILLLKNTLKNHFWYGANVLSLNKFDKAEELNSFNLLTIGDDNNLLKICDQVEQFLSGIFFAVDAEYFSQNINNIYADTEDEQYRSLDINGVLIEIRLLDTSYFEIYSENKELINQLAVNFKVGVRKK